MRRVFTAGAALALCASAYAQTPGAAPKFEAADVSVRTRTGTTSQPGMTDRVQQ